MAHENSTFFRSPLKVISEIDVNKVHRLTMDILAKKGILFQFDDACEVLSAYGARKSGNIVYMDESIIEKALGTTPKHFFMQARGGNPPLAIGEKQKRPVVCSGNGTVFIIEKNGYKRKATLDDFDNITKLCESSPVLDMVGAVAVEPCDLEEKNRYLRLVQHLMRHSNKPLIGVATDMKESENLFTMLEIVYGQGFLRDNPVIAHSPNPVSPLSYDPLTCQTLMAYAKNNQVNMVLSAPMAGLTGPLDMYGMAALINAEVLAGLCLSQAVNPGSPFIYSCGGLTADMRWANSIGAAPEGSLINMAVIQLAKFYNLPSRAMAGISEAKMVDYQAGMETAQNYLTLSFCGVQMVNQSVGVLDSLMSTSYEKWILDEELLSRTDRIASGLGTFDHAELLSQIDSVPHGGNYLMEKSTFDGCKNVWTPGLSFWQPYQEWEKDKPDIIEKASKEWQKRINNYSNPLLDPKLDDAMNKYIGDIN
jgi:trimethylamine---corrinoid protein Co-methyltransferase